jgi:hypothetical protein
MQGAGERADRTGSVHCGMNDTGSQWRPTSPKWPSSGGAARAAGGWGAGTDRLRSRMDLVSRMTTWWPTILLADERLAGSGMAAAAAGSAASIGARASPLASRASAMRHGGDALRGDPVAAAGFSGLPRFEAAAGWFGGDARLGAAQDKGRAVA